MKCDTFVIFPPIHAPFNYVTLKNILLVLTLMKERSLYHLFYYKK